MVDDRLQPERTPSRSAGHRVIEPLCENATLAATLTAAKSANHNLQLNSTTVRGQVQEPPFITAVHPRGLASASGALANGGSTSGGDQNAIRSDLDVVDH